MARVIVTDAHVGSAVTVIRSLARSGHHVIAAGTDFTSPGFYSRHAAERVRYPSPGRDPVATAEALLHHVRRQRADLLVPVTDNVILPIVAQRQRFEEHCTLALAEPDALAIALDKWATMELARSLAVPTPHSALVVTAEEARARIVDVGWPVVLKPQASRVSLDGGPIAGVSVAYAGGFAGLARIMRRFEGVCPVLLQNYYPGDAYGVELLTSRGRPLAAFQHRRLREVPVTGGASSFRESVSLDPVLYEHAVRLLGALDWTGLAMVEFKVGAEGPRLMEINGRIWGSLPLAVKAGMDFPSRMADLFLSGPPPEDRPLAAEYRLGIRSRNLELDVMWVASVLRHRRRFPFLPSPQRRRALFAGARLFTPADGFDILDTGDPLPGVAELVRIGGKLPAKVAGVL
jgi:predicted ATP-grasp superfamily ATP-dependent carboligase